MNFETLKQKCETSDRFKTLNEKQLKQYKKEIFRAFIAYENKIDVYDKLEKNKEKIQSQYVLPYLLGFTDKITDGELKLIQVKKGSSGGIDIDTDWQGDGREKIYNYLLSKYSKEQILHVGTFSELGPASAAKDLLRVYGIDFSQSNNFTKVLEKELSWEENLKNIEKNFTVQWKFYLSNKKILDLVPYFINKVRQSGKHAGGIVILPKPVYNYIPVDRVNGEIVTAFPESGQEQVLDELGIVKYDILGISILDVISNAIDMIDEELYLIEDDDGLIKIVGENYIDEHIKQF